MRACPSTLRQDTLSALLVPSHNTPRRVLLPSVMLTARDSTAAQLCALGGITERLAIRALSAENGRFVVVPVTFLEVEATVLCPEEEPETGNYKCDTKYGEEGEESGIVNVLRGSSSDAVLGGRCSDVVVAGDELMKRMC